MADIDFGVRTSPLTWLASLAFWSIRFTPIALVSVALVGVVAVLGVLGMGNLSIEAARRRAGLVSQLRFAVTLQDLRTVVLLRRQLSQEKPRSRPVDPPGPGSAPARGAGAATGRASSASRWSGWCAWPCSGRWPACRSGLMWRGATPMVVVAGLALYLAAYDAVEPVAQEIDHPTRWESFPEDSGRVLLAHMPAAVIVMLFVAAVAGGLRPVPGARPRWCSPWLRSWCWWPPPRRWPAPR